MVRLTIENIDVVALGAKVTVYLIALLAEVHPWFRFVRRRELPCLPCEGALSIYLHFLRLVVYRLRHYDSLLRHLSCSVERLNLILGLHLQLWVVD